MAQMNTDKGEESPQIASICGSAFSQDAAGADAIGTLIV